MHGGQVPEMVKEVVEVVTGGDALIHKAEDEGSVEGGGNGMVKKWDDSENNHCVHAGGCVKVGDKVGRGDQKEGQDYKASKGKHRVSKTWKRLVQEVSKRKPLSEIAVLQNDTKIRKRRQGIGGGELDRNQREDEGKKKARLDAGIEDEVMLTEVVESSLNGAPTPQ